MNNGTDLLLEYLEEKLTPPLPGEVLRQAKLCLVDYLGAASAGMSFRADAFTPWLAGLPEGGVSVIGSGRSADGFTAALLNGFSAHALELDDGHRHGMIHLGAPVISAVLAAAQLAGASGTALLEGIVAGYEAAVRAAVAIQPAHKLRGFHTAGTCGTLGAALGATRVLGLDRRQTKSALSAAGSGAAGLLEIQEESSELKPWNTGHAAMTGLAAALTGRTGLPGPDDILDGPRGLSRALAEGADLEKMTAPSGFFEIQRIYRKPYAACRHCHSAVEAAIRLREAGIEPEEVAELRVDAYRLAVKGHDHKEIRGVPSAKLSIPYSVAAAYLTGDCGLEAFTPEMLADERLRALTEKVTVAENGEFTRLADRRVSAVRVTARDGRQASCRVDYARGDPENPIPEAELLEKFRGLMAWAGRTDGEAVLEAVRRMEEDAAPLYALLA